MSPERRGFFGNLFGGKKENNTQQIRTNRDIIPPTPSNPAPQEKGSMPEGQPQSIFPDKTVVIYSYEDAVKQISQQQEALAKKEISQNIGTWNFIGEYPDLPHAFVFMTDEHFGSNFVDYKLLTRHHQIIETTPNMGVIKGGDLIDAFSPVKHPTAIVTDSIPPDEQAIAQIEKLRYLDSLNKLGAVQTGNHDDFISLAGMRFQSFLREARCPIYSGEGILNIIAGGRERYQIWWSHTHWGTSKLNITNAAKRALQFNAPEADLALLGHTHQAAFEMFDMAGRTRGAIVGGTYKLYDSYGAKWGMGHPGQPGMTVMLWPNQHKFQIYKDPEDARDFILGQIAMRRRR